MAEEKPESAAVSSAALALAMGSADTSKADAFLDEQTVLTRLQIRSHHVQHISGVMKLAFEFAVAFIGLSVAVAIGGAIWSAAHDDGLVIEAFSVPADFANRGLTGQVVASQMLDKLTAMQKATDSARPADSYSNNWGDDIKVQIPDTGISIGEFNRYLRGWLGSETHITGEITRTASGIAVTARKSGDDGATFLGKESDLDKLIQQAALSVYARTQPYRYAVFVSADSSVSGNKEAKRVFDGLITDRSPRERAWAYVGLANLAMASGEFGAAASDCRRAISDAPDQADAWFVLGYSEYFLGHAQAALASERMLVRMLDENRAKDLNGRAAAIMSADGHASLARDQGDFDEALRWSVRATALTDYGGNVDRARQSVAIYLALLHDARRARETWLRLPPATDLQNLSERAGTGEFLAFVLEQWNAVIAMHEQFEKNARAMGPIASAVATHLEGPMTAYALARTGDIAGALSLIAPTPVDCYRCLEARARIDTAGKNWSGAAYWFARAVQEAPEPPDAYFYWGQMLLQEGDLDGAIEKFREANVRGPHFADPLEMWGEALMLKNRSDLALGKFEQADKYAPNWGRLHLKWAESLFYVGRRDEEKKQFEVASHLDLFTNDRRELSWARATHGS
jgi:tetratricopeptide (TPR) repeat protein